MRLFHTPRTSFLLTTRLWKHNSCSAGGFFGPRMFCLFTVTRDDDPKELLCAVWSAKTLFNSGTELETAEWIKFLVLDTRFSSNSSQTHRLILSSSSANFVSSCLYFPACPVIRISGSQPPSTIASRSSPNCWTCFVVEVDVRCWLWGKSSLKKRGIFVDVYFL